MNIKIISNALWVLSALTFALGFYVGMYVDAPVGAGLWVVSIICALAPFAAHRNKTK